MGAADLLANGKEVAVIDYHTGDAYTNAFGTSRLSYYGLSGTPTAWFDGGNAVVGGSNTNSMYSSYLPKYNTRINTLSSFTIDVSGSNSGLMDYDLEITIEKVAVTSATSIALHVVVTESDIAQNWQGMTVLHHVERLMAPNQNGTALDFSSGDIVVKNINFSVDPSWVNQNCEVIVFLQNTQNKEVLQGTKIDLSSFETSNTDDAAITALMNPQFVCENVITPKVIVANYGLDNLTSLDIVYDVNGESPMTHSWTGNLSTYESEIVVLDEISFTIMDNNTITVNCENPNGQTDQFPGNDMQVSNMAIAPNVTSPIGLALKLDANPEETTWEVLNSTGDILYSGGPYTTPNQFIVEQFNLEDIDCYSFVIYDEGGNGLSGQGLYKLVYNGATVVAQGKDYGFEDQVQFGVGIVGVDDQPMINQFNISPNPVESASNVSFRLETAQEVQLKVFNTVGKIVYQSDQKLFSPGIQSINVDRNSLESGLYFIQLSIGENQLTKKVIFK